MIISSYHKEQRRGITARMARYQHGIRLENNTVHARYYCRTVFIFVSSNGAPNSRSSSRRSSTDRMSREIWFENFKNPLFLLTRARHLHLTLRLHFGVVPSSPAFYFNARENEDARYSRGAGRSGFVGPAYPYRGFQAIVQTLARPCIKFHPPFPPSRTSTPSLHPPRTHTECGLWIVPSRAMQRSCVRGASRRYRVTHWHASTANDDVPVGSERTRISQQGLCAREYILTVINCIIAP